MRNLALLTLVATILAGCVKNNPDPSWLEVTAWTLEDTIGLDDRELTHDFSDAWVYVDDKLIGVFEVPFKIPLLLSGESKITLYPTIRNNGISAVKKIYPFVQPYTINATLVQNQTLTINPTTKYYPNTQFTHWDFEGPSSGFDHTPESIAFLGTSNDSAIMQWFNGNKFGRVDMDATFYYWQAFTQAVQIPQSGAEVYLELNYHNTVDVVTGVLALESSNVVSNVNVQLNRQDPNEVVWKKIYIDLKTIVSGSTSANAFQMSYEALLPDSLSAGQINLDNIKLVHF